MTFQPSRPNRQTKPFTEAQKKDALKAIVDTVKDTEDLKRSVFERLDDTMVRILSSGITFTYYLLSLTAACIAFAISLTVKEKFLAIDIFIIVALISWVISFMYSLQSLQRDNSIFQLLYHWGNY
ncbi:hypothetical protein [Mucilaginibacter sp. NFX135]|uniref:hypothetical protein n=1 Tax=Mucilaginibacter sp. NFX135 TaxID=3402687 RepID=UPI003AFA56FF